jgi:PAS domain S-box-containing protein
MNLRVKSGEMRTFLSGIDVIEIGNEKRALTVVQDITERKRAQEAHLQSQQKFAIMFEKAPFGAIVATLPDGLIVDVNESFEHMFGYTRQEVIGKTAAELGINPEAALRERQSAELRQRGSTPAAEMNLRVKSGEMRTFLSGIDVVEINNEKRALTVVQDITERKQAQEAQRLSEARLAREVDALAHLHKLATLASDEVDLGPILGEIVDVAIAISAADFGIIQLLDPKTSDLRIVGHRGLPLWWLNFWDKTSKGHGVRGGALERGERVIVEDVEHSPIFADTPSLEMQLRAGVRALQSTPLFSRSGTPLGVFSTHYKKPQKPDERALRLLDLLARQAADILERSRMEASLRASEDRFRSLAAANPKGEEPQKKQGTE